MKTKYKVNVRTEKRFDSLTGVERAPDVGVWIEDRNGDSLAVMVGKNMDTIERANLFAASAEMYSLLEDISDKLEGSLPDKWGKEYTDIKNLLEQIKHGSTT